MEKIGQKMKRPKRIKSCNRLFLRVIPVGAVAVFAFFLFTSTLLALFEDLGIGAKGPSMGNALVAAVNDINAVHYNPAGLAKVERSEITASHGLLFTGLSDGSDIGSSNIAFAYPLGKEKAFGILYNRLSLSGLYSESTIQVSYGRRFRQNLLSNFLFGGSLKYLNHSFTKTDEAYDAMDGINATNEIDPVLVGDNSKSAFDLDLGVLWEISKKYTFGIAVKNLMQPNMSFSGGNDPVSMKVRAGLSHKSLWMLLCAQANFEKAPSGNIDKSFTLAVERIFPSLRKGNFGARSSLSFGDRDFKQITAGISYKLNKIGLDYGFVMPIGTVKAITGNHRFALSYYFGGPTVEEQYAAEVLEQFKKLKEKSDYESTRNIASLDDKRLKEVQNKVKEGDFRQANLLIMEKAKELLPDSSVLNLAKRIALVARFYPVLGPNQSQKTWEKHLRKGIGHLLRGNDSKAIKEINFAQSLNQEDMALNTFLDKAEELTHVKADRVPGDFKGGYVEYLFYESDMLYNQKKYKDAVRKLHKILEFEPSNLTALKKLGSCHYLMENYSLALSYWDKAFRLETNSRERKSLMAVIKQAKKKTGSWESGVLQEKGKKVYDAAKIEKLYRLGADLYLKGEYGKAADIFRKILTLDPQNGRAKKALERILRLR